MEIGFQTDTQLLQTAVSTCTGLKRKRVLNLYAGMNTSEENVLGIAKAAYLFADATIEVIKKANVIYNEKVVEDLKQKSVLVQLVELERDQN